MGIIIFAAGLMVGFVMAAFVSNTGTKSKEQDAYELGYQDGKATGSMQASNAA